MLLFFNWFLSVYLVNRNIRSKSKQYFLYQDWLDRGIVYISDLLNPPHPGNKLFEELILTGGNTTF